MEGLSDAGGWCNGMDVMERFGARISLSQCHSYQTDKILHAVSEDVSLSGRSITHFSLESDSIEKPPPEQASKITSDPNDERSSSRKSKQSRIAPFDIPGLTGQGSQTKVRNGPERMICLRLASSQDVSRGNA